MDSRRRRLLKGTLAALTALVAGLGAAGRHAWAAVWPSAAFTTKSVHDTLQELFGKSELTSRDADIKLSAPDLAENGAVVPINVTSTLPGVESITILVEKNPNALVAHFKLAKNAQPFIKTNIKMAETAHIIAVMKVGDALYSASKKVKVTLNGCGN